MASPALSETVKRLLRDAEKEKGRFAESLCEYGGLRDMVPAGDTKPLGRSES